MDNNFTLKELAKFARTKQEAQSTIVALEDFAASIFNTKQTLEQNLDTRLPMRYKTAFVSLCKKHGVNLSDTSAVTDCIKGIKEALRTVPSITITLAFEPTEEQIHNIADWLFLHCKKMYQLDIVVDHRIIGGVVLVANGRYYDYSLAKKLEESQNSKIKDQSLT